MVPDLRPLEVTVTLIGPAEELELDDAPGPEPVRRTIMEQRPAKAGSSLL